MKPLLAGLCGGAGEIGNTRIKKDKPQGDAGTILAQAPGTGIATNFNGTAGSGVRYLDAPGEPGGSDEKRFTEKISVTASTSSEWTLNSADFWTLTWEEGSNGLRSSQARDSSRPSL